MIAPRDPGGKNPGFRSNRISYSKMEEKEITLMEITVKSANVQWTLGG